MSKRRISLVLIGVAVLAIGLFVVALSVRRLPPSAVKPNAKPIYKTTTQASLFVGDTGQMVQDASPLQTSSAAKQLQPYAGSNAHLSGQSLSLAAVKPTKAIQAVSSICVKNPASQQDLHLQNAILNLSSNLN